MVKTEEVVGGGDGAIWRACGASGAADGGRRRGNERKGDDEAVAVQELCLRQGERGGGGDVVDGEEGVGERGGGGADARKGGCWEGGGGEEGVTDCGGGRFPEIFLEI